MSGMQLFGSTSAVAGFKGVARTARAGGRVRPGATSLIALSITLKC